MEYFLLMYKNPEFLEIQLIPSVEVRTVPELPTDTKSPFPWEIPQRILDVPEFLVTHEIPSAELRIVPLSPTVTKLLFA